MNSIKEYYKDTNFKDNDQESRKATNPDQESRKATNPTAKQAGPCENFVI